MELTPGRIRAARIVALAADFAQIVALPVFSEGIASPINDVLDVAVAVTLVALLGWHWSLLPSFLAELVPLVDLVPTWSATVFLITRGGHASGPDAAPPTPTQPPVSAPPALPPHRGGGS